MNILYLNNYNYIRGGAESVYFAEAELMEYHGHMVSKYARKHPRNILSNEDLFFPEEMITENINLTLKSLKSLLQIFYSREAKRNLLQMLDTVKVEIAHAHNIYGRLTTSVLDALSAKKIPAVITLHDYKVICPSYKLSHQMMVCEQCKGGRYYRCLINKCHKDSFVASAIYALESFLNEYLEKYKRNIKYFISPSKFLKKKLVEFGWDENKIVHIPNFIYTGLFTPNFQPGSYFLYFGRLSHEKGVATLLDAFLRLSSRQTSLHIAGEGPLKKEMMRKVGLDSRIQFLGYILGKRLHEVIRNALAIILPSEWYENAPMSILEAFALGKPVIGARIGGIPEMIDEGVNGFLFEPGNVAELTERIEHLLRMHDEDVLAMGLAAREKVKREFSPERHYSGLMETYSQAMGRPCA